MVWIGTEAEARWAYAILGGVGLVELLVLWRQELRHAAQRRRNRQMRRELEIYARLDASFPPSGEERELAVRVCRVVVQESPFPRAALLLEDAAQRLYAAGSAGFDDVTVEALNAWGTEAKREMMWLGSDRDPSYPITLRPSDEAGVMEIEAVHCRRALILPLETANGHMLGALAVGLEENQQVEGDAAPLEVLAVKLARTLEKRYLTELLLRTEKMAGLGRLAQELAEPLAVVLGYAELIGERSSEPRVREDAQSILHEARSMRETVAKLLESRRPVQTGERLRAEELVREPDGCEELPQRGAA